VRFLGFLLPAATGVLLFCAWGPGFARRHRIVAVSLTALATIGLAAVGHVSRLWWLGPHPERQWILDAGLLALAAGILVACPPGGRADPSRLPVWNSQALWLWGGSLLLLSLAAAVLVMRLTVWPHGPGSDSVAIWSLKARMLAREEVHWTRVFDSEVIHSRYPLLLPGVTARLWIASGHEGPWAPAVVAGGFAALVVLSLTASVAALRGPAVAAGVAMALCLLPDWLTTATDLIADLPLSAFALASVLTIVWSIERPADRDRPLCLAGLFAGLASVTKTEGHLVAVASLTAVALVTGRCRGIRVGLRRVLLLLSTSAPLIAWGAWLLSRHAQVPSEYLFGLMHGRGRLLELDRHRQIVTAVARWMGAHPEAWLLVTFPVLLSGPRSPVRRESLATTVVLLSVVAGAYYVVYLVTPYPLDWQLSTSLHRLIVQYWPAYVATLAFACQPDGKIDTDPGRVGVLSKALTGGRPRH
jgi:hypothetical protein